jgi:serine O-acetyltransferase
MNALSADIRRYQSDGTQGHRSAMAVLLRRAGLQVLIAYRLGEWLRRAHNPVSRAGLTLIRWAVYVPLRELLGRAYGITLDGSAEIGPGLYIGHGGGIELRRCSLGAHCSIAQQTKIGPLPGGWQGPRIGHRVWIGAHARVLGPIVVGDGATIAAGARVSRDVPPRCLVAGNPARVVRWDYDNSVILGDATFAAVRTAIVPVRECEPGFGVTQPR